MIIGNINGALLVIFAYVYLVHSNKRDVSKTKVRPKSEGSIFSDVIKNISRVNHVLQELIQNYEQLQKLTKPESLEADYSTDEDEIDEEYKEKRHKKNRPKQTSRKGAFPATEMIISEEQQKSSNTENVNEVDEKAYHNVLEVQVQKKKFTNKPHKNATHRKSKVELKFLNETNDGLERLVIDDSKINRTIQLNKIKHKRTTRMSVIERKSIVRKMKRKRGKKSDKHATRGTRVTKNKMNISVRANQQVSTTQATTNTVKHEKKRKKVRKVVYSESFAEGNIWKDIADEKPIRLKANPPIMSKRGNVGSDQFHYKSRHQPKTALVIVTKNNRKKIEKNPKESDSVEDELDLDKEEFKANVLRQAYGDACLKVVIKKCHKACKAVLKLACSSLKCKSAFKENYIDTAKTKCITQFKNNATIADTSTKSPPTKPAKRLPKADLQTKHVGPDFKDATRTGFDFEACYPFLKPDTNHNGTVDIANRPDRQVNILRDRFEKACQKASTEKCSNACRDTGDISCEEFPCDKSLKKALRKRCPKQCKIMYRGNKGKKSRSSVYTSESSGSSDSSGNSDSDSSDSD